MKLVIKIGVVVALLLILGVIGLFVFIDSAARAAVERGATTTLGVATTLDSVDVGVFKGEVAIHGLVVENPPGFTGNPFLTLNDGGVAVSLGTLRNDTIELPDLTLNGLNIQIDRRKGDSNYGVILSNIQGDRESSANPNNPKSGQGANFIIRKIVISDVVVNASFAPIGGEGASVTIPIDKIELHDVGSDNPMPLGQVAGVIIQAVMATVVEKGGSLLPGDMLGDLTGSLDKLGDLKNLGVSVTSELGEQAQQLLKGVGDVGDKAQEKADEAVKDVKKKLKGIGKKLLPGG